MQYIQNIKNLCSEVATVMPAQITIDFFSDFEDDSEGEEKTLSVPKNYELYITVK